MEYPWMVLSLVPPLFVLWYFWPKKPGRTSWVYCPNCHHDLNGDNDSYQGEDPNGLVSYVCSRCKTYSCFDFAHYPVPVLLRDKKQPE